MSRDDPPSDTRGRSETRSMSKPNAPASPDVDEEKPAEPWRTEYDRCLRGHVITNSERRAQAVSWVYGNLALMGKYSEATHSELQALRRMCEAAVDDKHPEWLEDDS